MLRRNRDDEPQAVGNTYQIREKLASIGDDSWIDDANGQHVFKVNDKVLHVRNTLVIEDLAGTELVKIQQKLAHVRETMEIEHGDLTVKVKKRRLGVRDHFVVDIPGRDDLEVTGNLVDHEYRIGDRGNPAAEVSKKWFRVRDTYGVSVAPGQDDVLMLAITVCIDQMTEIVDH